MTFQEKKYIVVRDVLSEQTLSLLQYQSKMLEEIMCYNNNTLPNLFPFCDSQTNNSFSQYGSLFTESLLLLLQPLMEEHIGKKLLPTYSYMRIYYKDSFLARHTDRNSCEYSATICIKCNPVNPWPIFFVLNSEKISVVLKQGDICIYKGDELPHWREPSIDDNHIQFFVHYVDSTGKYSDFKFDKRPLLGFKN